MGKFNHFRYVIVAWVAIGLFIVTNIEKHLTLILLELASYYNISKLSPLGSGLQAFQYSSYISQLSFANFILLCDSKVMLAIGLGGMSVCHLLIPTILPLNNVFSIILCILQGLFHGMIFPFFLTVMSFWTPMMENTTFISISLFGYWLGLGLNETIFFKLTQTNFNVPFYVFGALGLCWTVLWSILAKGQPSDDPKISQTKLDYFLRITTLTSCIRKQIFKTGSTFSIFLVILCNGVNFAIGGLMVTIIESDVMLDDTILYSYLVAAFVIVAIALISDHLRQKCCITKIRRAVICTGLLCSAIIMPFITIINPRNPICYSVLLGSFVVVQAIIQTSCLVNLLDVMHHAAGLALGVFRGLASLIVVGILVASLGSIHSLTNNNSNVIFWVATVLNAVGCLLYAICGSAKREIWVMNQAETTTKMSIALKETGNESATPSNV